jgi:flagellar biosynthetic protein FlhB
MSNGDLGQERTEAPTPRRLEEARREGQIAVSADLNTGVQLLMAALVLTFGISDLGGRMLDIARDYLGGNPGLDLDAREVQLMFSHLFWRTLQTLGLLLAMLFVSGVTIGVIQSGFAFYPDLLTIRWDRLDFTAGLGRIFSAGSGVRALTSLLKVAVLVVTSYVILRGRLGLILSLDQGTLVDSIVGAWNIVIRIFLAVAVALLILGVFDYTIQRVRLERRLRMTRQEAKEELKQTEGDPVIRARIRRLQREAAQRRMFQEVPRATVVITNPIHLAVALRYDRATMNAPKVVALGAGIIAERIIDLARRHAVPVVENRPLAQALHRRGKLDQEIPLIVYQAVAEVLAFVYRLRA